MERTLIKDIKPASQVRICGFIENLRDKRTMQFIVLRDATGKIQVTVDKEKQPEAAQAFSNLSLDSVVQVVGKSIANEAVKLGGIEIIPDSVQIFNKADALPIGEESSIDKRLDFRFLDLRSERNALMLHVQAAISQGFADFVRSRGFLEIHTPKLIAAASESGAEVFEVKYFGSKAYLAQSPQFYKQMAMSAGLEKVYEIAPVFRAEKSSTNRHATEFISMDLEMSYIDSFLDLKKLEEEMLIEIFSKIKEQYGAEIERLFNVQVVVPKAPFPMMSLKEIYAEFEKMGHKFPTEEHGDLSTAAEQLVGKLAKEKFGHEFMFVTGYSAKDRAFYHMRDKQGIPQGYDLVWKGVEITTCAQREHRYEILKQQAEEKGLAKDVQFYLEFFKYGCPPHGGMALGLERMTRLILNLPGINEACFIYRSPDRLTP